MPPESSTASWENAVTALQRVNLPARLVSPSWWGPRMLGPGAWQIWDWVGVVTDVESRKGRESFVLTPDPQTSTTVLDADRRLRHLLVLVWRPREHDRALLRYRLLFGHDERHLFVVRMDRAPITRVRDAFECLKPREVRVAQAAGLRVRRQGEWFFVPAPELRLGATSFVRRKCPLNRWGGHPHVVEELAFERSGEDLVIHARGSVRHADHSTLKLQGWHRVYLNVESTPSPNWFGFSD